MSEVWQIIKECDNYSISETGKVRRNSTGQILAPIHNNNSKPYIFYNLWKNGVNLIVTQSTLNKYIAYKKTECIKDDNQYTAFSKLNFLNTIQPKGKRNYTHIEIKNVLEKSNN